MWKPFSSICIATISLLGGCVFLAQQLSANYQLTPDVDVYVPSFLQTPTAANVSSFLCILITPLVALEMYWHRDHSSLTWYGRYKDTTGVVIFQVVSTLCFMAFFAHVATIHLLEECSSCKTVSFVDAGMEAVFRFAYWSHVTPSLFISILAPLQFLEPVRKFWSFFVHRWVGRILMLCAVLHQLSATAMISAEVNSATLHGAVAGSFVWWHTIVVFFAFNIWAWVAIIVGWWAIARKSPNIKLHGEMMHRLGASWFSNICAGRMIFMPMMILSPEWAFLVGLPLTLLVCFIATEIYLKYAGRFATKTTQSTLKCPFLGTETSDGSLKCPFLAEK